MPAGPRLRTRVVVAFAASLASVLLGYLLLGHFDMATLLWTGSFGSSPRASWHSGVYYLTHSRVTVLLIGWVALVLAFAAAGIALVRHDPARRRRGPRPVL